MRAEVVFLPPNVRAGSPPTRLFDELHVFSEQAIVGVSRSTGRTILFDGWPFVESTLGRSRAEIESWSTMALDEGKVPCEHCRTLVADQRSSDWSEDELEAEGGHHPTCSWARKRGKDLRTELPFAT